VVVAGRKVFHFRKVKIDLTLLKENPAMTTRRIRENELEAMKNGPVITGPFTITVPEPKPGEEAPAERLVHLERDRWPEFERELQRRRPRRIRFSVTHYRMEERARWEWMIARCRTWSEVERVLNRHGVDWKRERGEIAIDGMNIYRCA
jgi:hypothetical protein